MIISDDGSAEIDGVPVPAVGDEPVDVAILDTLHGYARSRGSAVTATISDPAAGYVAVVEVAPDGSSRLLEQHGHEADEDDVPGPAGSGGYPAPPGPVEDAPGFDAEAPGFDNEVPDFPDFPGVGDERGRQPQPVPPALASPPAPLPGPGEDPGRDSGRRGQRNQSDDEYRPTGLLKRPAFVGAAGVVVAAVILIPLIALGSSGGGEELNQSAGATREPDGRPTTQLNPGASDPTFSSTSSPSLSDSAAGSKNPASKETKDETAGPVTGADPGVPKDEVLIRNMKYGLCVDLPGTGESAPETRAQDAACEPSGDDNQQWVLDLVDERAGTHGADLYLVRNVASGRCLDVPGEGPGQVGSVIGVDDCVDTDEDNQRWWLNRRPNGTYSIRNQKSADMCLDSARTGQQRPHTKITLFGCTAVNDQQWSFFAH
ncbi:RICIN domain-containing protein [Streptomyces sp. NBC_01808]|uniref:RICIN domain-containing protein n=1 Tax=Streptomyces sp. NBC_01808 TaxID=2975947 RepID=UPI002DD9A514|nr:RICIN domain-containing protein [Streptomyces sp. NBC_01808]WSA40259.1 RICIN domain-containing protein [Streptomyces sp. NBC_01808]